MNTVEATILFAFLSASSRGLISVIDRFQFGYKKLSISLTNIANNLLALLIMISISNIHLNSTPHLKYLFKWEIIVFGLVLQLTAQSFSYAFKHMKINQVIFATKTSDLFIPFAILLVSGEWSLSNVLFSISSAIICFPLLYADKSKSDFPWPPAFLVIGMLLLQSTIAPFVIGVKSSTSFHWMSYTSALIFWRLIFSIILGKNKLSLNQIKSVCICKKQFFIFLLRAVLTISAQGFLVLSLSKGNQTLAWPILNSTGLFSLIFASLILKERAHKMDYLAISLISIMASYRWFY